MTPKEILKEAFDNDIELLKQAFEADKELLEIINEQISKQITVIWTCLIDKGIIKIEDFKKYQKEAKEILKEGKE